MAPTAPRAAPVGLPDAVARETFGRREFLRRGAGGLLLALGGALPGCSRRIDEDDKGGPLAESDREVLRAICARLLPASDAPPAAEMNVARRMESLLAQLGPRPLSDFRRLLALFEWSPMLFDTIPGRFTRLSAENQDQVIRGWATSRLGFRRSGFVAVKRLAMSIYYSQEETWPAIGFPGPWPQS